MGLTDCKVDIAGFGILSTLQKETQQCYKVLGSDYGICDMLKLIN